MAASPLIACENCSRLHERTPLEPGAVASCTRCGTELYRQSRVSVDGWIALALTAAILFAIANFYPIVRLNLQGLQADASLPGALLLTWQQNHEIVAILTGLFGFWMPLLQILIVLWALLALRSGRLPGDFAHGLRLLHIVAPWSMIPVLMLGVIVAMVKFAGFALMSLGPAIWAYAVLTFIVTGLSRMSSTRLWQYAEERGLAPVSGAPDAQAQMAYDVDAGAGMQAGADADVAPYSPGIRDDGPEGPPIASCASCGYVQAVPARLFSRWVDRRGIQRLEQDGGPARCGRCGSRLYRRKPNMDGRVWAFLLAACIAYVPANVLPVMRIRTVMGESAHTILGGVLELWNLGSPDLAVIVFVASIVVPVTKLAILMLLLLRRRWKGEALQRSRTRLYDFINFIGQWSMLDVFVVILMSAMANFPGMSQVIAGPGAASFGLVVVLTILAAESYDPRSGWDRDPGTNIAPLEPAGPHVRTPASHAVSDAAEQCYDRT